ncbi:MAG: RNA polymerase sigma factor for flagellar operon FliA [Phycisphaerales bacterium]|jgi:RNA polymerase sigma factor for flagellar operon FliA
MPSTTVQKIIKSPIEGEVTIAEPKKPLTKAALKGRVPKGLDITVSTPRGEMVLLDVWLSYKNEPTLEIRNVLMEHYLQLVRYTAERVHTKLPSEVDVDDLYSAGLFGLMQAIDAYDLERGFKFETYCTQRVRGAIYDELRAMDWVPRLVRSRSTKVDRARKSIEMTTGLKATDEQVIQELEVDNSEYEKIERDSRPIMMTSLNRKAYDSDSSKEVQEIDVVRDKRQENPVLELQRRDLQLLLTKGLTRAERLIVVLYYYEEMTMKEIGLTLDLSESRVSQMHSSILARLKAQMQHRSKEF